MMMSRRSTIKNSSTTSLVLKKSAAAQKPMEVAVAAQPQLPLPAPQTQSTRFTQTINLHSGHYDHNLQSQSPFEKQNKLQAQPIIEYPVSPDLDVQGEGITNSNHPVPQHRLIEVNRPNPFTCMGCKEYGAGTRFTCQQCNFELHNFCALAPPVLKAHPLHSQHQLVFYPKPAGKGLLRSKCDVCGKPRKGYMFQCGACSFELHPCCAMLSAKMKFPNHPHPLIMIPGNLVLSLSGDQAADTFTLCSECKRKRSGQVYRCTVCDYYLHAVCAKTFINGLHANGIKGLDKPSMLGVAAKIASQVVVGFVGGIFEGIGEGLGEALTQNFAKGKCNTTKPTSSSNTPS